MNASEFLLPNRLGSRMEPQTGGDSAGTGTKLADLEDRRRAILPLIIPHLQSPDHNVRGAAALAVGKLAGAKAIPLLRDLFRDPHPVVRHGAILGMGLSGAEEGVPLLLQIATNGSSTVGEDSISPWAPSFAIAALGIGRCQGLTNKFDSLVAGIARQSEKKNLEALGSAAMAFHCLAPNEATGSLALALAQAPEASTTLRSRAIEALGKGGNPGHLTKILPLLAEDRLEVRRAAALALGGFREASAIPYLQEIVEKEKDEVLRGYALISLGRSQSLAGEEILLRNLQAGPVRLRAWAALGLGVSLRARPDALRASLLRERFLQERNAENQGAYLLAMGLARDAASGPVLEAALRESKDSEMRSHAAVALAISGWEGARDALVTRLGEEKLAGLRGTIALSLGHLGDPRDVALLLRTMRELRHPSIQGTIAAALGFHGSEGALQGAIDVAKDPATSAPARAAAIEALGLLLGEEPVLWIGRVARQSTTGNLQDWIRDLIQFTI